MDLTLKEKLTALENQHRKDIDEYNEKRKVLQREIVFQEMEK